MREQLLEIADRCSVHRALNREIEIRTRAGNGDALDTFSQERHASPPDIIDKT